MKKIKYASLVVFSYNRPNLLKKLLRSLKRNSEAKNSTIYFFQDNWKNKKDKKKINECRRLVKKIKGFKKVKFFLRKKHYGFYKNFVDGLKQFFRYEKKGIILEDDLEVSKYFLKYMNHGLNTYEFNKKVWHISGWNYDLNIKSECDAYFIRNISSWGWGTWSDRFKKYQKNPKLIINRWSKSKIKRFNLDNKYDFFSQIIRNYEKKINSFGVFWYATIFERNGLCLSPIKSLITNNGWNNKATHTKIKQKIYSIKSKSKINDFKLPEVIEEDKAVYNKIKNYIAINKIKMLIIKLFKLI